MQTAFLLTASFVAVQSLSRVRFLVTPMNCCMPGFHVLHCLIHIIVLSWYNPITQMKKLRIKEAKISCSSLTARKWQLVFEKSGFFFSKYLFSCESESCLVMSNSLWPRGLYSPWNSPGQNTGVGSLSFLQRIFPTQGSNPVLLHCRWILHPLSHKGSPLFSCAQSPLQLVNS